MKIVFFTLFSLIQFNLASDDYLVLNEYKSDNIHYSAVAETHQNYTYDAVDESFRCAKSERDLDELLDCTIRIRTDDMDIEVTFEDVSLWTCAKLKVGNWWNNTFN